MFQWIWKRLKKEEPKEDRITLAKFLDIIAEYPDMVSEKKRELLALVFASWRTSRVLDIETIQPEWEMQFGIEHRMLAVQCICICLDEILHIGLEDPNLSGIILEARQALQDALTQAPNVQDRVENLIPFLEERGKIKQPSKHFNNKQNTPPYVVMRICYFLLRSLSTIELLPMRCIGQAFIDLCYLAAVSQGSGATKALLQTEAMQRKQLEQMKCSLQVWFRLNDSSCSSG